MPPRFPARAFSALQTAPPTAPAAPYAPSHVNSNTRSFGTSPTSTVGASSSKLPPTYPLQRCARRPSNPKLRQSATAAGPSSASRGFHATAPSKASAKDPYDVLGVKKDAAAGDIKKAYYQLAKKWHPDTNKDEGANERFVEIQTAYDILSDDKKRQAYDRYGSASQQEGFDPDGFARGAGGFGGFQDFGGAFGGRGGNAGDLFEQLFGQAFRGGGGGGNPFGGGPGGQRQRQARGDDIETTITLSFLDAAKGIKRTLVTTPVVDCKPCTGSGLKPGEKKSQCTTCRGTGQQTFNVQGMYMASTCTACGGEGSTIPRSARCGECDGVGRIREKKTVEVEIPAGIDDGMKVKMPSMGDMPLQASGPPGDLFVRVNVIPSKEFRRQGTNVYHDAKVPLHTALLGGRVRVATLEGDVEKQLLGAYAETTEGRTPEVHFGPLASSSSSPSSGSPSTPPPTSGSSTGADTGAAPTGVDAQAQAHDDASTASESKESRSATEADADKSGSTRDEAAEDGASEGEGEEAKKASTG